MNKCVFLDRDGVINKDYVDYAYTLDKFQILPNVPRALKDLKEAGFLLVIITNQSGIVKGVYTKEQMQTCHDYMQSEVGGVIDHIYYSPYHPRYSESLSRKPGTLMFEKAIAKFDISIEDSWMVGDKLRDMQPALKMGLKTIQVDGNDDKVADYIAPDLFVAAQLILSLEKESSQI